MSKDEPPPPDRAASWTRVEDYVLAIARQRWLRRRHPFRPRSQPEDPHPLLSNAPFAAMIGALGLLTIAIAVAAWPGRERPEPRAAVYPAGTAPPSWWAKAKQEMKEARRERARHR